MERILYIPDWHLRDNDFKEIVGYVDNIPLVANALLDIIKEKQVTKIIFLGDLYDGGYHSISEFFSHQSLLANISEAVNGECYINLGNHFFNKKNINPEAYLIQPCPIPNVDYYPSKKFFAPSRPILKVVDELFLEGFQFVFHHFSKNNKEYITNRRNDAVKVIATYHDETIIPYSILQAMDIRDKVPQNSYLTRVYDGVDIAILGHAHLPYPVQTFNKTVLLIPGSLAPTSSKEIYRHKTVSLPLITVDSGTYSCSSVSIPTFVERLNFLKVHEAPIIKETLKVRKAAVPIERFITIGDYIDKKGYLPLYKDIISLAMQGKVSVQQITNIIKSQEIEII